MERAIAPSTAVFVVFVPVHAVSGTRGCISLCRLGSQPRT